MSDLSPHAQDLLEKSFWGDERKCSGALTRVGRRDVREPPRSSEKRRRTRIAAGWGFATVQPSENHLSRDFRSRSIFDFCNKIRTKADVGKALDGRAAGEIAQAPAHRAKVPLRLTWGRTSGFTAYRSPAFRR
jgi:hypothetical protein